MAKDSNLSFGCIFALALVVFATVLVAAISMATISATNTGSSSPGSKAGDFDENALKGNFRAKQKECDELSERIAECDERLKKYDDYGNSAPQSVIASLTKAFDDRAVDVRMMVKRVGKWRLTKEPYTESAQKSSSVKATPDELRSIDLKGWILGVRSSSEYILAGFPDGDGEITFNSPRPEDFSGMLKGGQLGFYPGSAPYEPDFTIRARFEIEDKIRSHAKWRDVNAAVMHAWKQGGMTLMVIGFDNPNAPRDMRAMPYKGNAGWLKILENSKNKYPISLYNGIVGLAPSLFDRSYDHRGQAIPWEGIPGSVSPVFLPFELSQGPVIHSFIFQLDRTQSFWVPAYQVNKYLNGIDLENFKLDSWVSIKVQTGANQTIPWHIDDDGSKRHSLLQSYMSLVGATESF